MKIITTSLFGNILYRLRSGTVYYVKARERDNCIQYGQIFFPPQSSPNPFFNSTSLRFFFFGRILIFFNKTAGTGV